jgi:enoyl-CoA hydratase/carnithine racemase
MVSLPSITLAFLWVLPVLVRGANFGTITTTTLGPNSAIIRATMSHPPINLFDPILITDMHNFLLSLSTTVPAPKVVIISSSLPGYFMNHLDLRIISTHHPLPSSINATDILAKYFDCLKLLASLPQVFIGEVNGNAYGAGDELLVHMDMRFAGPRASIGAAEVALGILHVGGLQQLTKLIGTGLSSEWMLSANPITGSKAAAIGWFNGAYDTLSDLTENVDALAERIALWPYIGLNATKSGIRESAASAKAIQADIERFNELSGLEEVQDAIDRVLQLGLNQSASPFEANLLENLPELWE